MSLRARTQANPSGVPPPGGDHLAFAPAADAGAGVPFGRAVVSLEWEGRRPRRPLFPGAAGGNVEMHTSGGGAGQISSPREMARIHTGPKPSVTGKETISRCFPASVGWHESPKGASDASPGQRPGNTPQPNGASPERAQPGWFPRLCVARPGLGLLCQSPFPGRCPGLTCVRPFRAPFGSRSQPARSERFVSMAPNHGLSQTHGKSERVNNSISHPEGTGRSQSAAAGEGKRKAADACARRFRRSAVAG